MGEETKLDLEIEEIDPSKLDETNEWFTRVLVMFIKDGYFAQIFNNFISAEERPFLFLEPCVDPGTYSFVKQDMVALRDLGIVFSVSVSLGQMGLLKFLSDLVNGNEEDLIPEEVMLYLAKLMIKLEEVFETIYMHENTIRTLFV